MKVLNRQALNKKMSLIFSKSTTLINAPLGFGKTSYVNNFLSQRNIDYIYFSMQDEHDELWVWQKVLHSVQQHIFTTSSTQTLDDIPQILYANIPSSQMELDHFIAYFSTVLNKPLFIVLDDLDIQKCPSFTKFISLYDFHAIEQIHFIVITQNINADLSQYLLNQNFLSISTSDFTLSREEINLLFKNENIILKEDDLEYIHKYTQGWIVAAQIALDSYKLYQNFYNLSALDSLIEENFYNTLPQDVRDGLMKLSILKEFTLEQAIYICQNQQVMNQIIDLQKKYYFFRLIDQQTYTILPLLRELLKKKLLLSSFNRQDLYELAGDWYLHKDQPVEAIQMYLEYHQFEKIIYVLITYNEISFTDLVPNLMTQFFHELPDKYKNEYPYIYLRWICDCITNLPWLNGEILLEDFKSRIMEDKVKGNKDDLLGEYYFIHAFTYYNDVTKMLDDFINSYHHFHEGHSRFAYTNMIATFGSNHLLYLYFNKAGSLHSLVNKIQKDVKYFIHISNGVNTGSDFQVQAEYFYETGHYDKVFPLLTTAYNQALQKNQLSIAISSLFLLGRLSLFNHDMHTFSLAIEQLQSIYKETGVPILHGELDCALTHLHLLNNQKDNAVAWLRNGQLDNSTLLHEASSMAYIVYGLCLNSDKKYKELEDLASTIEHMNISQVHIFGLIYAKIYHVIAQFQQNLVSESLKSFQELLDLCAKDSIITPLLELSSSLISISRIYTPINESERHIVGEIINHDQQHSYQDVDCLVSLLTPKEYSILSLVAQNKTMKEIANILNISINTVQTHMKTIYRKLNVNTKIEAIRIFENKD